MRYGILTGGEIKIILVATQISCIVALAVVMVAKMIYRRNEQKSVNPYLIRKMAIYFVSIVMVFDVIIFSINGICTYLSNRYEKKFFEYTDRPKVLLEERAEEISEVEVAVEKDGYVLYMDGIDMDGIEVDIVDLEPGSYKITIDDDAKKIFLSR